MAAAVVIVGIVFAGVALRDRAPEIATTTIPGGTYSDFVAPTPGRVPPSYSRPIDTGQVPTYARPMDTVQSATESQQNNRAADLATAEQARLAREQLQRQQAVRADQMRVELAHQEAERQKAAGKDEVVPLNQFVPILVGDSTVDVKIVDNDVTSFDVWINGDHRQAVPKQKGISGSRTDETFLYSNGRASLYYVWEISGRLNHCTLRVRDE